MRWTLGLALGALFFAAGCSDPQMAAKLAEMEKKQAELEGKVAELQKGGAAKPAAAAPNQPPPPSPDEAAAMDLLKKVNEEAEKLNWDAAKSILAELKSKYPSTRAATSGAARIESEIAVVGKPVSAFTVEKWHQGNVDLNAGKATVLVFWEVWCPHCKREVPKLEATYKKYQGQGLQLVGLTKQSRDITDEDVKAFLEKESVSYPVAKEKGDLSQFYAVQGVPAAAVVKGGQVVWRGHPARLTDEMIQGWL